MAIGSRRTTPTLPVAAAVVSDPIVAPRYTPCVQLKDCSTRGTVVERRPPKMIALIGTPIGSSMRGDCTGLFFAGEVKRLLGCAAFSPESFVHGRPCQSISFSGTGPSLSSHQGSLVAGSTATLVKMVSRAMVLIAFALDFELV